MRDQRPDPDELLARVQQEEAKTGRGRLKIFFGAAAGVGKTYAMLEAAHARHDEGVDIIAGYVEPHRRPETEALMEGLEMLPLRVIDYRGTQLREFDLDAALARRPTVILMDELAHTNAPGSRHPKRWQDVEELLAAGIDVYTTVNVQHLESLNDVVAQITGTIVKETIPDSMLERADEVELIDLSPDDLLKRLQEGKIYMPQQAQAAMNKFFRKGNLMALRELSLRRTAERVDDQMQVYRQDKAVAGTWAAGERILVCISPSPLSTRLVRAAKRMATGLRADWTTVYVETSRAMSMPEAGRNRVIQTLRLAEQLGAETVTLNGDNVTEEILNYARKQNVTRIVIGKPIHSRWRDFFFGSVLDTLVRQSGTIDIYVISGEIDSTPPAPAQIGQTRIAWGLYARALGIVAIGTAIAALISPYISPANLVMVYLLGNVVVANRYGRGASIFTSILSVIALNFFFVPPYLTFSVNDSQYLITFAVMLVVGLVISGMTVRIRGQAQAARERERRTSSLYELSRAFANTSRIDDLVAIAIRHIEEVFESQVIILLPRAESDLQVYGSEAARAKLTPQEDAVVRWVYDREQPAGWGTATLPGSAGWYLPLLTSSGSDGQGIGGQNSGGQRIGGVFGLYPVNPERDFSPDQRHFLETFTNQTALAIERAQLTQATEQAEVQIETERLRNSLLSSVSHDLRTPLAAITGAASGLLAHPEHLDAHSIELAQIAYEEAERLNRLVGNLLEMTRLESGAVQVDKEWQPLEEVIGITRVRMDALLKDHPLNLDLPDGLPLVSIDGILIEQVFVNLLENAVKYTPPGTPIDLKAWEEDGAVIVEIADRGPGLTAGDENNVFDKFYRARPTTAGGVGLGLTICRAIIEAHGGHIRAVNRSGGGAAFRFTLPFDGDAPRMSLEPEDERPIP